MQEHATQFFRNIYIYITVFLLSLRWGVQVLRRNVTYEWHRKFYDESAQVYQTMNYIFILKIENYLVGMICLQMKKNGKKKT